MGLDDICLVAMALDDVPAERLMNNDFINLALTFSHGMDGPDKFWTIRAFGEVPAEYLADQIFIENAALLSNDLKDEPKYDMIMSLGNAPTDQLIDAANPISTALNA